MSKNSEFEVALVLIAAAIILCGIYFFSNMMGLDVETGSKLLLNLFLWVTVFGVAFDLNRSWFLLPIAAVALWVCFFPALNYWSANSFPSFSSIHHGKVMWYATWWFKLPVTLGLGTLGTLVAMMMRES
ncbi:hypothetical protein [Neisseria musculi]|uniref:Membrane protein n=1 Tax=Neisseria musculi TaxID=1815583 RepID=A0A7H1MAK4_9NEIS|nr:hypothetical protein [Neisseria musculi]QNT58669.1 putative membrane protein [Neisseria musculi]